MIIEKYHLRDTTAANPALVLCCFIAISDEI